MSDSQVSTSRPDAGNHDHSCLTAALEYAEMGWPVLPVYEPDDQGRCTCTKGPACASPAKHPRTRHGFKDATTDETKIHEWWEISPHANVAVATGSPSGLVVVDFDPRHGSDESSVQVQANYGPIPETLTCTTGGGGQHLYLACPGMSVRSRTGVLHGIDVRGESSYIIAPPSRHASGRLYKWIGDPEQEIAELTDRLAELFASSPKAPTRTQLSSERYVEGERNDRLFKHACLMTRHGLSADVVEREVVGLNARLCSLPLSEPEVHALVRSAVRYGGKNEPDDVEFHSALYREAVVAESIRFRTAAEIAKETPSKPDWIAEPWAAAGAVTAVDGKPKAAGKTTWLMGMIGCVLDGKAFMGEATKQTGVVYLTEEGQATFREALHRAGLLGRDDLHVLHRGDAWSVPWPQVVRAAVNKCREVGAGLLVVDTVAPFAGLKGDKENNAGDQQEAFEPLAWARDQGLAVIANRHERKSSGDVGDSARGSNAFTAAADVIISIRRPEGNCKPTIREIHALSRFSETPDKLTIELTDDGYEVRDSAAVSVGQAEDTILTIAPVSEEDALGVEEIVKISGVGRTTAQKALTNLVMRGRLLETGRGVKGDPHRYHRQFFLPQLSLLERQKESKTNSQHRHRCQPSSQPNHTSPTGQTGEPSVTTKAEQRAD